MKRKNLVEIASVAIGTATLTVLICSGVLVADAEKNMPEQKVSKPKLISNGIEVSLDAENKQSLNAGDLLEFKLAALNPGGAAAESNVRIMLTAMAPANPLSRMVAMPSLLWQGDQKLALASGETKVIPITPAVKMPSNTVVTVSLQNIPATTTSEAGVQAVVNNAGMRALRSQGGIVALTLSTVAKAPLLAQKQ